MSALSGGCLALVIGPTITNLLGFLWLGANPQACSPGYWWPDCSSTFDVAHAGIYDTPMADKGK